MFLTRQTRTIGDMLVLGGVPYRLDGIEGCGGSAIVYQASYEDALNTESHHHVFIKELFPMSADGAIYRAENGDVVCTESGQGTMELSRSRFLMGNYVNLELLRQSPSGTSGNINSYEAYGTYYSVLALHGGKNLKFILEQDVDKFQVKEAVNALRKILRALDVFHRNGLLHLDISPDNILLLPEQALLIDYNSVWDTNQANSRDFVFSEKKGYSAAEIRLRKVREIGYRTDMFSVCAVFFHMLMGRALTEEEIFGKGLIKCFAGKNALFTEIPQTAKAKVIQILLRGLHILPRKRYQTVEELEKDLDELSLRIEGKGISASALWESSRSTYLNRKKENSHYLPQPVKMQDGEVLSQNQLLSKLALGENVLLIGPGGMGKTRFLLEIWKESAAVWRSRQPIFLYVSLKDYQQVMGARNFIRQSILKKLQFSDGEESYQDAEHRLELVLDGKIEGDENNIVLLLDGFNEAGTKLEQLLLEIEELGRKKKVGILITDRSEAVLSYALQGFVAAELAPLSKEQIVQEIKLAKIHGDVENCEANLIKNSAGLTPEMYQLLSNPMMLFLYIESMTNNLGVTYTEKVSKANTVEGLIGLYLDNFCGNAMRANSGNEAKQLCIKYILEHLLPMIALKMWQSKKTVLTFEEMCQISDQNYAQLSSRDFGKDFQEFREKSRRMLNGIDTASAWYDFAVNEILIEQFGLLVRTGNGFYTLLHDNFLDTLANRTCWEQEYAKRLQRKRWIAGVSIMVSAVMGITILMGAILGQWFGGKSADTSKIRYNKEEIAVIDEAVTCMTFALAKWNLQVTEQQAILNEAGYSDVLDNEKEQALKNLEQLIEQKKSGFTSVYASPLEERLYSDLLEIEAKKGLFSLEALQSLCDKPAKMQSVAENALDKLQKELCDSKSTYRTRDARERLVKVYQEYLTAEIRYTSYQLAMLLTQMPANQVDTVQESLRYMEAFADFNIKDVEIADVERAEEALKRAKSDMKAYNYGIE